jgi:hypothetical protein
MVRRGSGRDDGETGETSRRGHGPVFIEKATAVCLTSQLAVTGDSNRAH